MANVEDLSELDLSEGFVLPDEAEWLKLVESALKGRDFDKALVSRTYDDIRIEPLYTTRPADSEAVPARQGPWDIRTLVTHPDGAEASAQIAEHRRCGATSCLVRLESEPGKGDGVVLSNPEQAQRLDMDTDVCIEAGDMALAQLVLLDAEAGRQERRIQAFRADPVGRMASTGTLSFDLSSFISDFRNSSQNIDFVNLVADGSVYEKAGATEVQELAAALATAVHYLRAGIDAGLSVQDAADMVRLRLSTSSDLFVSIAKLRAGLRMWQRILQASGAVDSPAIIEAISASGMYTSRDPWVNMLRGTAAGMAGAIGGAFSITVLPYGWAVEGEGSQLSAAMARNIQVILNEESHLGAVCDPAAGSYAIEHLTDHLADRAWEMFQKIEAGGGMVCALQDGWFQTEVAGAVERKRRDAAHRKLPVTGVSEFPHLDEETAEANIVRVPEPEGSEDVSGLETTTYAAVAGALESGATVQQISRALPRPGEKLSQVLADFRPSATYEVLRDMSDDYLERNGCRPALFGAFIGSLADFSARAMFARNLAAAGGVTITDGPSDAADANIVSAFEVSGCREVVLCSGDDIYAARAAALATALKAAGAARIWLAGRPGAAEADYTAAGIDGYIYAGSDAAGFLSGIYDRLEGGQA